MASRSLDDLAPPVRGAALAFLRRCEGDGLHILIYCTLRGLGEQAALYAQGRTKPGAIVTMARPGQSLHNPDSSGHAWAFDAVPTLAGVPQWGALALVDRMGAHGEAVGLEWAGRWQGSMRERVHFQIRPGQGQGGRV